MTLARLLDTTLSGKRETGLAAWVNPFFRILLRKTPGS